MQWYENLDWVYNLNIISHSVLHTWYWLEIKHIYFIRVKSAINFMDYHRGYPIKNRSENAHYTIAFFNGKFLNCWETWEGWVRLKSGWRGSEWNLKALLKSFMWFHSVSRSLFYSPHEELSQKLHQLKTTWIKSFTLMHQFSVLLNGTHLV